MSFEKLLLQNRQKLYDSVKMTGALEMKKRIEESNARDVARNTILTAPKPDKIFIKDLPKGILLNGDPEYRFLNIDGYSFGGKSLQEQFTILEKSGFPRPLNIENMSGQEIQSYLLMKIQQVNQAFPVIRDINMWLTLEPKERNDILAIIGDPRKLDDYNLSKVAASINANLTAGFTTLSNDTNALTATLNNTIQAGVNKLSGDLYITNSRLDRNTDRLDKIITNNDINTKTLAQKLAELTDNFSEFNNNFETYQGNDRNPLEEDETTMKPLNPLEEEGAGAGEGKAPPPNRPTPAPNQQYEYALIEGVILSEKYADKWRDSQPNSDVTQEERSNAKRLLYDKGFTQRRDLTKPGAKWTYKKPKK